MSILPSRSIVSRPWRIPVAHVVAIILAAIALPSGGADAQVATTTRPTLRVGRLVGVRIDGKLDEAAWSRADSTDALRQTEPVEGAAPTGRTVVRVLADGDAIVIGIRADDPDPRGIVSFARARDASLGSEDHVLVVLDTYLDGRSGYVFGVNPTGARYDALITGGGSGQNGNWDAVWEAAATRTPTGWSAEMRIPVKSLLFRPGLDRWGFNVQRRVQRRLETDRWSAAERDYGITQTSRAGLLTGLPPFSLGLGLGVRPAMTTGGAHDAPGAATTTHADASLDATQRIGTNAIASVTVNTDFAETEVDGRRTNLTRFPVSFPEKRTFFLEGSDIFDFGASGARPFFSRRIGLLGGRAVPIVAGTKVNGRAGATSIGALAVRTGRLDSLSGSTMGVARIRQNVLGESSVGAIATVGDPAGRDHSWLAGADATFRTSRFLDEKNLVATAWGLATGRDGLTGRRGAGGGSIELPNDRIEASLDYSYVGDGFRPSLGFVPRPGVQTLDGQFNFRARPTRRVAGLRVRTMAHELEPSVVTDLDGRWESYEVFTAPLNWRLESGERIEFNVVPFGERLVAPFEIADDVEIPAGSYHWTRYRLEGSLAAKRPLSGQVSWWFGPFYSGRLHELEVSAVWKPSPLINVEISAERNAGALAEGRFTQDLLGTRLRVNVSPALQINSLVQYDNDSESFGTNTRMRWSFSSLGDVFLVYNHNLSALDPITHRRRLAFASNELLLKAQYALRY